MLFWDVFGQVMDTLLNKSCGPGSGRLVPFDDYGDEFSMARWQTKHMGLAMAQSVLR